MKGCTSRMNSDILQPVIETQVNIIEPKGGVRPPIMMVPLVKAAGVDLVHFGIVVNVNIMIGGLTPPFGSMMFTCVSITGCKMSEFIREVQPFILALIIALLLITYIPGISLLLPNLIY